MGMSCRQLLLLAAFVPGIAPSPAAGQARLEATVAAGPAGFTDRKLSGGFRSGLEIQAAALLRLGAVALGIEAGTVGTGREPGTYGCIDPNCTTFGYSNYYSSRVSHVVIGLRAGDRRLRRPYLAAGLGYYHVADNHEPPARSVSLNGLGAHVGMGVGLADLSDHLRLGLEARWHAGLVADYDSAGLLSFVTVTAGVRLH